MAKLIWIIIGLAAYFIGGWIAKDIVFSMIEITEETTLGDITIYECYTYSAIAAIFSLIASSYGSNEGPGGGFCLLVITIVTILVKEMPLSVGLIALYNIVNVACIICAVCTNKQID